MLRADSATISEIVEDFVNSPCARADQLRDFLRGQVVGHEHCFALASTKPLRQLQQLSGDPGGHVGEIDVGQVVGISCSRRATTRSWKPTSTTTPPARK
jgi:hypothetical protein